MPRERYSDVESLSQLQARGYFVRLESREAYTIEFAIAGVLE